jgi:hypothetical protein
MLAVAAKESSRTCSRLLLQSSLDPFVLHGTAARSILAKTVEACPTSKGDYYIAIYCMRDIACEIQYHARCTTTLLHTLCVMFIEAITRAMLLWRRRVESDIITREICYRLAFTVRHVTTTDENNICLV